MLRIDMQSRSGIDVPFRRIYLETEDNLINAEKAFDTFFGFRISDAEFPWGDVEITFKRDTLQDKDNNEIIAKKLSEIIDLDDQWHVVVPFISRAFLTEERFKWQGLKIKSSIAQTKHHGSNSDLGKIKPSHAEFYDFNVSKRNIGHKVKSGKDIGAFRIHDMWGNENIDPKPRELVAFEWRIGRRGYKAFPRTAYLRDKNKYYQPICNACPRRMLHEMGECELGDPVCYLQLKHYDGNTFVGNYSKYKNIKRMCDGDTDDG